MCITFNKVGPVQLIYHDNLVTVIDVTHTTDMNFHLNYSAVMKYQNNFKFKVTNYNTFALKNICQIY